jgi:PAS domain S-box-containing protein
MGIANSVDSARSQLGGETSDGVLIHVDGVVADANCTFAEMFGFAEPADVVGTNVVDLIGTHSRATVLFDCVRRDGTAIVVEANGSETEFHGRAARVTRVRDVTERQRRSLDLREATERFRLAFEGAPIGIALVSPNGQWLQVNPALCRIVGYSADELFKKTFQDITHPDDLEADLAQMYQVLAGELPSYSMEKRYFHADGHVVWVNLSVSLVRNPTGEPLYFISQIEDVSERRRAAAELAAAEKRFRALVEFAPEAMVIVDPGGVIKVVNRQTEELFGYCRAELCGQPIEMLMPEGVRDAHVRHRTGYETNPSMRPMGFGLELYGRRRDGTEFPVEISLSPLEDETGSLVSAAVRDITERKRVEGALLRESETVRLLERVAVAANEASSVDEAYATTVSAVCAHTRWSAGHVYLTAGDGTNRLVSSGIWHFGDPSRLDEFRRVTEAAPRASGVGLAGRVLATGRPIWIDKRNRVTDSRGEVGFRVGLKAAFAFPVLVGEEVVAVFEFFDTVAAEPDGPLLEVMANVGTQLGRVVERARHQEQQRELDSARAQFVANAAHELRTPVATLRGVAGLLGTHREDMTPEEITDCFEMLDRQGANLEALVRDLLDLSRIEHDDDDVPREVVPVERWIARALELAPPPDHVKVQTRTHPRLAVCASADRLNQVLVNLLTNGYSYGGPDLAVSAGREGDDAVITVEDNGGGVPERLVGQLFEPFTRGANHGEGGSGLGLAISRRIVERFGGHLLYERRTGGGACFVVRLPVAP